LYPGWRAERERRRQEAGNEMKIWEGVKEGEIRVEKEYQNQGWWERRFKEKRAMRELLRNGRERGRKWAEKGCEVHSILTSVPIFRFDCELPLPPVRGKE
jgi:hypothetical protein